MKNGKQITRKSASYSSFSFKIQLMKRMYRLMSLRWIVAVIIDGILKMVFDFTLLRKKKERKTTEGVYCRRKFIKESKSCRFKTL